VGGVSSDTLFWIGIIVLVAIVVGGGAIVIWARRSAKAPASGPEPGFTLDDMRRLLERGEITQREFDTARDALIHRTRENARKERERLGGTDWGGGNGQDARR
jgi:hypothetical protein